MNSAIVKIQTVKGEQKLIPRLLDQLLTDLDIYQIDSIERIDRIVLYRDLIAYQSALRAEECAARRNLLNELRPKSIPSHPFREPTLAELQSTDWDGIDRDDARKAVETANVERRRQVLLETFAGRGRLADMQAVIARHRGQRVRSRLELWPMPIVHHQPIPGQHLAAPSS